MGISQSLWGSLWGFFNPKKSYTITMIGLDGAGKTTLLYKMKRNEVVESVPTIGFNVETIQITDNISMTIMDVGGQDRIRDLWKHYYEGVQAIIFVVDSNDIQRLEVAKKELHKVLKDEALKQAILLVLANKQDLKMAASVATVADTLGLRSLENRKWFIQGTCATSGNGISSGLAWLAGKLDESD